MQIGPNKNATQDVDADVTKSASISNQGFRFPKWVWVIVFVIFGGYAGIKQFIADSPKAVPTINHPAQKNEDVSTPEVPKSKPAVQGAATDSSVKKYAKQLADKNKVTILGEPRYDLENPMQLIFYSTSDGSAIMCSLKRVECFFNSKKYDQ
jgi:hypothetical protein